MKAKNSLPIFDFLILVCGVFIGCALMVSIYLQDVKYVLLGIAISIPIAGICFHFKNR